MPTRSSSASSAFAHRPSRYTSAGAWLIGGLARNRPSAFVALLVTWFFVPLGLLFAALGLVVGALGGASLGAGAVFLLLSPLTGGSEPGAFDVTSLLSGTQVGGVLGALLGALLGLVSGAWLGLRLPWLVVSGGEPVEAALFGVGQFLAAVVIGLTYTVYAAAFEGWRFRIGGARRLSRREHELLAPLLSECAGRLGISGRLPALLMDDTREVNAYAGMGHVVVNVGLLEEFNYDREVLAAVLCHELTHWNNADAVSGTFVHGLSLPLYVIYNALTALQHLVRHPLVQLVVWLLAWPVLVAARYFVIPVQARDGRDAEYRADSGAVLAGHGDGVRKLLTAVRRNFEAGRNGWDAAVCRSHPPAELRLERVEQPGQTYTLPDEHAPARPLPVTVASTMTRD